jgi:ABC-type uncharacterized transport system permease subunit
MMWVLSEWMLLTTPTSNGNFVSVSDYLDASLRLSVPLAFAALGGLWSERTGVLNIGLEGMLLAGAFASAAGSFYTHSVWVGLLCTLAVGALVGLLHAFLCVTWRVNQIVSGLAINLVSVGITSFLARVLFGGGSSPQLQGLNPMPVPVLQYLPILGQWVFQQDLLVYVLIAIAILSTYFLFHTSLGLSLRAVGEYPHAADASGVNVILTRYAGVITSGILASLGGAYLTLVHVKFFAENMSAGKGFIALAALIFGRWHPIGTALACLLFGASDALQLRVQALNIHIPYQFLIMLPYAIALLALIGLAGQLTPPTALGIPYSKESHVESR